MIGLYSLFFVRCCAQTDTLYQVFENNNQYPGCYIIGVEHKEKTPISIKTTIGVGTDTIGSVFTDTIVINNFISNLVNVEKIPAEKIVLIVEEHDSVFGNEKLRNGYCMWVTPQMRKMKLRWVGADTRSHKKSNWMYLWQTAMDSTTIFIQRNFKKLLRGDYDSLGLPVVGLEGKKILHHDDMVPVRKYLPLVFQGQNYEYNLRRLCIKYKELGYTPVIIAGSYHVMALGASCYIQSSKKITKADTEKISLLTLLTTEYTYLGASMLREKK